MMIKKIIVILIGNAFLLHACAKENGQQDPVNQKHTFYFDNLLGNDLNDGLSPETSWESLDSVNMKVWNPGDSILFVKGGEWSGSIHPQGSGSEEKPIYIGSYGNGEKPKINGDCKNNATIEKGQTVFATVYLQNQSYWEFNDLELTNYNAVEEDGLTLEEWEAANVKNYVNVSEPLPLEKKNTAKCAILVEANGKGKISHLYFKNLEIHSVNGDISSKNNGGIFLRIYNLGENIPTWFNDVLIENCHIHDVDRTGISNWSDFSSRNLTTNTDWLPSTNYVIRGNVFERTGANALIVRVAQNPLIEKNIFDHCAIKESGNACFNFNTDGAIWQYNESRFTKANLGDEDAGGIDSDYRSKNTLIQYNYLHDNDFGMLVTGGGGVFNNGTVVRYNIFEREGTVARYGADAKFVIRVSGEATNTVFHNNLIYLDEDQQSTKIIFHKKWSTWPASTSYYNNIIYNLADGCSYDLGSSTGNEFANNLFYGNSTNGTPTDVNQVNGDPLYANPGNGVESYNLQSGSPALEKGKLLDNMPALDYFENSIPVNGPIDIGIHQLTK